jgi:hypothetical protein
MTKLDELISKIDNCRAVSTWTDEALLSCVKELKARIEAIECLFAEEEPPAETPSPDDIATTTRNCARCGLDHSGLTFHKLSQAVSVGGKELTHWGMCPTTREPILMEVVALHSDTIPPAPDGKWRDLDDDESWKRGDRWTSTGDKGWHKTVLTSDTYTIGAWKQDIFPMRGQAQRRVKAKRSKWVSVCDHLPPLGLTVCVKVADDPDPQADWLNDMSEWETETHVTHWHELPVFKAGANDKRPGLAKLVKRIEKHAGWKPADTCIKIYSDGTGRIENEDGQELTYFNTIAELKDYLASLPEVDS